MNSNLVRSPSEADSDAIASLLTQLGYPTSSAEVPDRLARLKEGNRCRVFVAEREGVVIGLATVHLHSAINRAHDVATLSTLVVDKFHRGSGIGRALALAVEDFARESNCERLTVTTQEHRTAAHAFYLSLGFEHTGRRFGKMI